jgi:hypothetical protein
MTFRLVAILFLLYCLIALYRTPGVGYGAKVLMFFDLFVCACVWRIPDVTISSKAGLAMRTRSPPLWARFVSEFCNIFEADHCEKAIKADLLRAQVAQWLLEGPNAS